jgi:uracil-DNA glycosylase
VILGQDPYHGPGQAHGLSFSVGESAERFPPSLRNIFKELANDLDYPIPDSSNLEPWARQGVLLLNTVLTVRSGEAHSHKNRGWESFTDAVIESLNSHAAKIVFVLWGKFAQKKSALIDDRHIQLFSPHPSPLSAHRGFFGSRPFSKINEILESQQRGPIDWRLK